MATKTDLNTHPSSSDLDLFPGSLAERQARSYRPDPQTHRGTAVAVVGSDGLAVGASLEGLLSAILYELRALRLGQVLSGVCEDLDDITDPGDTIE